ncbi:MAG: hypothetical protein IKP95_12395 [Ruminococcus sp.]|nr:hypothetical protein [Ruminococcus sp.]
MKDFLRDVLGDTILSLITKKYGSKLTDSEREAKVEDTIAELKTKHGFTVDMIQSIIDKKGLNYFENSSVSGQSVFRLVKTGLFGKSKVCYFITRTKEAVDGQYLDKIYDELNRQASGENVFGSPDYVNK